MDIDRFLTNAGWNDAIRAPLSGDASARRYTRLSRISGGETAMLMDAPPGKGLRTGVFRLMADYLRESGFSAPEIISADVERGLLLLEDLGDDLFTKVCKRDTADEMTLYSTAVDLLSELHRCLPPAALPAYSVETCLRESRLLCEWYLPAATGKKVPEGLVREFDGLVGEICKPPAEVVSCCVLRDYHAENLIWLPARKGARRVGLLDFQDALRGHPAYDLVSLLEDARRDTGKALRHAMIERYLAARHPCDCDAFLEAYASLGAQRNLKIIGIFTRLWLRDGKSAYLDLIPRVWRHLDRDLAHQNLVHLREFIEQHVPPPGPDIVQRIRGAAQ